MLSIQIEQICSTIYYDFPMSYFDKRHVGDIVSRFNSFGNIRELLTTGIVESVIDGIIALLVLLMM